MTGMKLYKQHQQGVWFVIWTFQDLLEYTVVRCDTMQHLKGSDPQALIKELLGPGEIMTTPTPKKKAKK